MDREKYYYENSTVYVRSREIQKATKFLTTFEPSDEGVASERITAAQSVPAQAWSRARDADVYAVPAETSVCALTSEMLAETDICYSLVRHPGHRVSSGRQVAEYAEHTLSASQIFVAENITIFQAMRTDVS